MGIRSLLRSVAVVGTVIAVASFIYMHLVMPKVHPVHQPVSMYELEPDGYAGYLVGTLSIAIACAALVYGRRRWQGLAMGLAAVAFVVTVLFPTDPGHGVSSVSGQVHRYSSGTAFGLVIVAGFLAAAFAGPSRWRTWTFALSSVTAVLMIVIIVNTFLPELANGGDWRGLPQRVLLLALAIQLVVLAYQPVARPSADASVSVPRARAGHPVRH
ncbi:MAG TPA: DUF998 domain-containing protein [Stackebrandtia sp.]|jgi:hypothetical protein|uniref:DUF998 domain-containing protein n=1 Tax=Stackebrandtia sp. TaxID=2023065 RepID=UPI002D4A7C6D|nr:DUF998 domain-containing protein [Stackebrandtia sp.]HZE40715.1 DUF998 domain-containing protein [Stackebrandtia sp.]